MAALARLFRHRRTAVPLLATALLGATVAVPLAVSSATAGASVTQSPGLVAGQTLSGSAIRGGTAGANAFGAWRGAPVKVVVDYIGTNSWASIDNVAGQGLTGYWAGLDAHRVWSVPLIPSDGSSSLATAATGSYNAHYTKVAQALVAGGDGNATIRLGWEMTGDWFAWSGINDPASFAGAFRQAVTAMRAVSGRALHLRLQHRDARRRPDADVPRRRLRRHHLRRQLRHLVGLELRAHRARQGVERHPHRVLRAELAVLVRLRPRQADVVPRVGRRLQVRRPRRRRRPVLHRRHARLDRRPRRRLRGLLRERRQLLQPLHADQRPVPERCS